MPVSRYYPTDIPEVPLPLALLATIQQWGDKVALVDGLTGKEYRYPEVSNYITKIASALTKHGLKKGDVLLMFAPNFTEYILVALGAQLTGAIVSTANPGYTEYELDYHIKDSTASFIYTVESNLSKVKNVCKNIPAVKKIICEGAPDCISLTSLMIDDGSMSGQLFQQPSNPREDIAFLPYSSGTTGLPKGVMVTHYNILANLTMFGHPDFTPPADQISEETVTLGLMPFYHAYGLFGILIGSLFGGSKIVCLSKFKPELFLGAIEKYKITSLPLVPPLILFLAKSPLVKKYDLSSVTDVGSGAAPLSRESEEEFNSKMPKSVTTKQGFGMTECTLVSLAHGVNRETKAGSVGELLAMCEGKVIDVNSGKQLGPYERGELCLRGPHIMKGYWNKPEATKNTIDEFGFLHTGDIAYYDIDGYFYIVDRIKELIKTKGLQVAPAELEGVLLNHPAVADVGVTGVPHPSAGEVPRAYVTLKPGAVATEEELKLFVKEKVADYKQLDRVVFTDEVPKTPSGKILRRKLKEMAMGKSKI